MSDFNLPISVWVFWSLYVPSLIFGLWKGGLPERIGAGVLATIPLIQIGWYVLSPPRYDAVDPISFVVDFVGIVGFGYLALNAQRAWPIWACAFQLLSFAGHFARAIELSGHPVVYSWMKSTPTLAAALCVLIGTLNYRKVARRSSTVASWTDWDKVRTSAPARSQLQRR